MEERKCIIFHIDDLESSHIQTTDESVIFFVSSAIYPYCFTPFPPAERLEQTVQTMQSIRKHVPNATVILSEASAEIKNADIETLTPYVDYFVLFAKKNMKALGKNNGEKYMSLRIAMVLQHCKFSRMYKLSGRYYLLDEFKESDFSDEKITLRRSTWRPERLCMLTVLYSVPPCQIDNYVKALENTLKMPMDIEHALFQSLLPGSYEEIPVVNSAGLLPNKELLVT